MEGERTRRDGVTWNGRDHPNMAAILALGRSEIEIAPGGVFGCDGHQGLEAKKPSVVTITFPCNVLSKIVGSGTLLAGTLKRDTSPPFPILSFFPLLLLLLLFSHQVPFPASIVTAAITPKGFS